MSNAKAERPDCYKCVHRGDIPGNCHSSCNAPAKVAGRRHGVQSGWFFWPINFDPVWLQECDSYSPDPADKLPPANPGEIFERLLTIRIVD